MLRGRVNALDARALVRALFMPLAQFVDDAGRHTHARFMLRLQEQDPSSSIVLEFESQTPTATEVVEALRERLPEAPQPVFVLRLRMASNMFLHAVAALDAPSGGLGMSPNTYMAHVIDACVAVLTDPIPPGRRRPA
jgi:response regulator RpfG family c-di-GMP phosphodiesterase